VTTATGVAAAVLVAVVSPLLHPANAKAKARTDAVLR
jgi:hypothetical protein